MLIQTANLLDHFLLKSIIEIFRFFKKLLLPLIFLPEKFLPELKMLPTTKRLNFKLLVKKLTTLFLFLVELLYGLYLRKYIYYLILLFSYNIQIQ